MSVTASSLDFGRRRVRVERIVGEATESRTITATLTVPAPKPDIDKILRGIESASVTRTTIIRNGVVVEGTLSLDIMYVAALPSQPVHSFEATVPFTEFFSIPGAYPDMFVEASVRVEFASYTVTSPRTVQANVILRFRVRVIAEEAVELVTEVPRVIVPPPRVERRVIRVERPLLEGQTQIVVTGNIAIPTSQPGASQIVHVDAVSRVTDVDVIPSKVVVDGEVSFRVLYVGNLPSQPVYVAEGSIDFATFVVLSGVEPSMFAFARSRVEHVSADIIDSRTIRVRAVVKVSAVVTVQRPVEFISRIEEPAPLLPVVTREFLVEEITAERDERSIIKVSISVPPGNPDIQRVVQVDVRVLVGEAQVLTDAVIVSGTLRINVLYVAALPGQPVYAAEQDVPFTVRVVIPGVTPDMFATADVDVESASAVAIGARTFDVRVVLHTWVLVTSLARVPAVVVPNQPGVSAPPTGRIPEPGTVAGRVHVVKPGESLWQIAQAYGVTVEVIIQANDLKAPSVLDVGETLVIPQA